MKKLLMVGCLLTAFTSASVLADASSDLKSRLGKLNTFLASFTQTVTSDDGAAVQQGSPCRAKRVVSVVP